MAEGSTGGWGSPSVSGGIFTSRQQAPAPVGGPSPGQFHRHSSVHSWPVSWAPEHHIPHECSGGRPAGAFQPD